MEISLGRQKWLEFAGQNMRQEGTKLRVLNKLNNFESSHRTGRHLNSNQILRRTRFDLLGNKEGKKKKCLC